MDLAIYLFKEKIRNINIPIFHMMIERNISLLEYFKNRLPNKTAVSLGIKLMNVDVDRITPHLILTCISEANPEAYNLLLTHPNGTIWIKKTLGELRELYT